MEKTIKLKMLSISESICKIGSELELEKHEIIINKEEKTIEGIKDFFEKLIIHTFQENESFILDMNESIKAEFSKNIDEQIISMIEEFVIKFNEINIDVTDEEEGQV